MTDVGRALEQIAEIHAHLAKSEVYRGWRSLPVAASGLVGLAAALWESSNARAVEPWSFVAYWLAVGVTALAVGCAEIAWHYVMRATVTERRHSRRVVGQFLPALVAGALVTGALLRLSPTLATLLPGTWALLFGVGVFAARPYLPRASGWVALFYWTAGLALLWAPRGLNVLSPWAVGGVFGAGQLLAALVLYWNLERRTANGSEEA